MKIILVMALTAWSCTAAGAQQGAPAPEPGQPAPSVQPPQPAPSAQPDSPQPPQPPASEQPPQPPGSPQPPQPEASTQPAHAEEAEQPAVFQPVPTTAPEPLPPLTTGILDQPGTLPAAEEAGINRVDTVAKLEKMQAEEIRTLRESLKGRLNAEIRKAVRAKRIEQRAALKALQEANKAEAEKYEKIRAEPAEKEIKE